MKPPPALKGTADNTSAIFPALFIASILVLYLELLLIRWIGTEVNIFAYLQNTVLVVCFLGSGFGCLISQRRMRLKPALYSLLILVTLLSLPPTRALLAGISTLLSSLGDLVVWDETLHSSFGKTILSVGAGLLGTVVLMVMLFEIFLPLGQLVGGMLSISNRPLKAYTVNVAGSLLGTWLFVLMTYFFLPPAAWILLFSGLAVLLSVFSPGLRSRRNGITLLLVTAAGLLSAFEPFYRKLLWSPYQKIALYDAPAGSQEFKYGVAVNNYPFQGIANPIDNPSLEDPRVLYDLPSLSHPAPRSILIVGAGTGNDVVGALRNGVPSVTAVEIDPAVIALGREYNPAQPYDNPAVKLVNDDARSFFATSKEKFDVILFALLDSHTTVSLTNARLDHYVYTTEAIEQAKSLLNPGGVMVLTFFARRPYITDRIGTMLRNIFGEEAEAFRIPMGTLETGGVVFIAGDKKMFAEALDRHEKLVRLIESWRAAYPLKLEYQTVPTTDNWPYFYLRSRGIPTLFYLLGALVLIIGFYGAKRTGLRLSGLLGPLRRDDLYFFLLGTAFLLLEVAGISRAAVLLGNTWDVNAVIISGVLTMVLVSNGVAALWPRLPALLIALCLVAASLWLGLADLAWISKYGYAQRAVLVGLVLTLPMLFSGLLFARAFAAAPDRSRALGINLFGAMFGAILQSATFLIGIRALFLVVAGLYLAAVVLGRPPRSEPAVAPEVPL